MHVLQTSIYNYTNTNWIDFYILLSKLSKSIRNHNKQEITTNLITCIHDILCFAKQNDIDMNCSWNRWHHKMAFKHYDY